MEIIWIILILAYKHLHPITLGNIGSIMKKHFLCQGTVEQLLCNIKCYCDLT